MKKSVIVHTNQVLPYSETFIQQHVLALENYNSLLLGSYKVDNGLPLETINTHIINQGLWGKVEDALFKYGIVTPFLKRRLAGFKPDILHSHFGQNGFASLNVARALSIPHVTTFHGADITISDVSINKDGRLHYRFRQNISQLIKYGDAFVAVSKFIENKLYENGFPKEKVHQLYLGIKLDNFIPDLSLKRDKKVICVARLVPYKGQQYLIDAMKLVQQQCPEMQLVLVGDGPEMKALQLRAAEKQVNVDFKGRLSSVEVKQELNSSWLYCQPSVRLDNGHEEALALTIVEAQAMGLPAIVFDSGGMQEAIVEGESGFVVGQKNVKELADRILSLSKDESLWAKFSSNAIKQVHERHCIKKQTAKLESLYSSLIGNT